MAASIRICKPNVLCSLNKQISARYYRANKVAPWLGSVRNTIPQGPPPEKDVNFADILKERNQTDPDLLKSSNIGIPFKPHVGSRQERLSIIRANHHNEELEKASRHNTLKVPLEEVQNDWMSESWPYHLHNIAKHYGIYRDLFNGSFFIPDTILNISYQYDNELVTPVYLGNKMEVDDAFKAPQVDYEVPESASSCYHTLIMTNPDSHLTDNKKEYMHWFIGNIPGNAVEKGELLCDYLPPIPARGTGFHRHIFVLFRHDKPINYSEVSKKIPCNSLEERTFSMFEFYRDRQDEVTPVGLSFFQTEWSQSVRELYHKTLGMLEPGFEYMHPPPYHPPQRRYPNQHEPFDRYFDRYKDKKDLAEEVLKMKVDMISPFKPYKEKYKYPIVHDVKPNLRAKDLKTWAYQPSWYLRRKELMHRRIEQYHLLPTEKGTHSK